MCRSCFCMCSRETTEATGGPRQRGGNAAGFCGGKGGKAAGTVRGGRAAGARQLVPKGSGGRASRWPAPQRQHGGCRARHAAAACRCAAHRRCQQAAQSRAFRRDRGAAPVAQGVFAPSQETGRMQQCAARKLTRPHTACALHSKPQHEPQAAQSPPRRHIARGRQAWRAVCCGIISSARLEDKQVKKMIGGRLVRAPWVPVCAFPGFIKFVQYPLRSR